MTKSIFSTAACTFLILVVFAGRRCDVLAFQPLVLKTPCSHCSTSSLEAAKAPLPGAPTTRRNILVGAAWATAAKLLSPKPAQAKYSTYARREVDWETRMEKGQIRYGTAQSVRRQLAELVPQNKPRSLKFCPNGPTAAVSPLMENKCGDWQAPPSVFGRTEDEVGNSIPGFRKGYVHATVAAKNRDSSPQRLSEQVGFPKYGPDPRIVMFKDT